MDNDPTGATPADPVMIELACEPVELYKVLKFAGLANSGGEAKCLIDDGLVRVNDAVETRRRRKIRSADVIELGDVRLQTLIGPESPPARRRE